jgi:two-component system sensor histidine kinase VicK
MSKATVQVKRMTAMINGFLNISRLESGQIVIDKRDFDLAGLINELIDEVQVTTGEHHIQLTEIVKVNMYADRDKIGSVLSNFLSNAVKYSPKGTNIDVACVSNVDTVTVSVKDEGMGLRQEDLEKIFDRYYRVESAETLHIAGFGIGLYLSAEIIKQHNGRIWVESELSKGSIFYFLLPL